MLAIGAIYRGQPGFLRSFGVQHDLRRPSRRVEIAALVTLAVVAAPSKPTTAQQPTQATTTDSFELASIRQNRSGSRVNPVEYRGETFTITNWALGDIIRLAYGIGPYYARPQATIEGVPAWAADRYDIIAKTAGPVTHVRSGLVGLGPPLNVMLQSLLADRFQMEVHWEGRERPGYALMLAAPDGRLGPGLRPSDVDCEAYRAAAAAGALPTVPAPASGGPAGSSRPCNRTGSGRTDAAFVHSELLFGTEPIQTLVDSLARSVGQPVIDATGLSGLFDMELRYSEERLTARVEPARQPVGPSLRDALRDQLGLRLERQRIPAEVLVIDRLERPSEN